MDVDVDALLLRLHDRRNVNIVESVPADEMLALIRMAQMVFQSQPMLVEVPPPVTICGDIHGQYSDLLRIFDTIGYPPATNYVFLGDYVDRGSHNLETIALLFCYKIKYPKNFYLLRGNHETSITNAIYGFQQEIARRYGDHRKDINGMWGAFNIVFSQMPIAGLIGGRILCMHGGLSPNLTSLDQIRQLPRGWYDPPNNQGIMMDLLWADPDSRITGWQTSPRGCSYLFGDDVIIQMTALLNIDMVVRAHQVVQDGYEINGTQKLVTVFSAPNYAGQFDNAGAVMFVERSLRCMFLQFPPLNTRSLPPKAPLANSSPPVSQESTKLATQSEQEPKQEVKSEDKPASSEKTASHNKSTTTKPKDETKVKTSSDVSTKN
ncbi:Serine/threonine-protein phosphatase [Meloidogyne graminicola]|uniref:Serine/threonine-protein phosphatase n=1 Tax=Meloidogyne graminicola TaxID=189291 RepID=A0A8S9ZW60_9BILA|nr:Serine/threonine-protein phosphatase [Meloidogyne graminicola]